MEAKEIILTLLQQYEINANEFAGKIGLNRPQGIYDILHGKTKAISLNMANRIGKAFPEIDRNWLRTGHGNMFTNETDEIKKLQPNTRFYMAVSYLINNREIYNKSDLSAQLEVQRSYISEITNGKRPLTEKFAEKFTEIFPSISKNWLLTGEGQMVATFQDKDLLKRIETIASKEGITITELEKTIGASKGVISRALKNGTDIQAKWICRIAEKFPDHSASWLLTGKKTISNENDESKSTIEDKIDRIIGFIERIEASFNK